jgi:hypothetical protein
MGKLKLTVNEEKTRVCRSTATARATSAHAAVERPPPMIRVDSIGDGEASFALAEGDLDAV